MTSNDHENQVKKKTITMSPTGQQQQQPQIKHTINNIMMTVTVMDWLAASIASTPLGIQFRYNFESLYKFFLT